MQHVQHIFSALLNQLLNDAACREKSCDNVGATLQDETKWYNTGPWVHVFLFKLLLLYFLGSCFPNQGILGKLCFRGRYLNSSQDFFLNHESHAAIRAANSLPNFPRLETTETNQKVWRTIEFVAIQAGSCSCKFCNHSRRWQSSQVDRSWKIGLWQSRLAAFGLTSMVYFTRSANW